jgi:RNA polymerase sigma-70 factor (ECF subfamily)
MNDSGQTYDELLVLKCREGDPEAFEELLCRWQKRLWQHAWRLVGREDEAWDVLQDALVGIAKGIAGLESPGAFGAWAYRIVTFKSRDHLRRESRRRNLKQSYEDESARTAAAPARDGRAARLKDAVRKLPGSDRALLALKYEDGFDIESIAAILDIPPGTVKSRLYHARQRLKRAMEDES